VSEGAADPVSGDDIDARILDRMWEPRYRPYRAGRAAAPEGAANG
jgi:hypothetical protein